MTRLAVVREWRFTIDHPIPNLNQHVVNAGPAASRRKYRKIRDDWQTLTMVAMRNAGIPKANGPRFLDISRMYAGRMKERDNDNFIGGMKPVVDAFVGAGLLVDDSPKFLRAVYRQERLIAKESGEGLVVIVRDEPRTQASPANANDPTTWSTSELIKEIAKAEIRGHSGANFFAVIDEINRRIPRGT